MLSLAMLMGDIDGSITGCFGGGFVGYPAIPSLTHRKQKKVVVPFVKM